MSTILEKAFDAGQKIIRTIFQGSPNLFTTSDVNRQVEAFKYQADYVEQRTGVTCVGYTFSEAASLSPGSVLDPAHLILTVTIAGTATHYVESKGCRFSPSMGTVTGTMGGGRSTTAYLCVTAVKKEVAFNDAQDNPNHEIAGARFGTISNYTSKASANQLIYKSEQFELLNSLSNPAGREIVAVLYKYTWDGLTAYSKTSNIATGKDLMETRETLQSMTKALNDCKHYDLIISNNPNSSDGFCGLTALSLDGYGEAARFPKSILVKAGQYVRYSESTIINVDNILAQGIYVEFEPGVVIEDASAHTEGVDRFIIKSSDTVTDLNQLAALQSKCKFIGNGCEIRNTGSTTASIVSNLFNAEGFNVSTNVNISASRNVEHCSGNFILCFNVISCQGTFGLCHFLANCTGTFHLCSVLVNCNSSEDYTVEANVTFSNCSHCTNCVGRFHICNYLVINTGYFSQCKMLPTDTDYISPTNNPGWNTITT